MKWILMGSVNDSSVCHRNSLIRFKSSRRDTNNQTAEAAMMTVKRPPWLHTADNGVLFLGLLYLSRALYILWTHEVKPAWPGSTHPPQDSQQQMKRAESFSSRHLFCIFRSVLKAGQFVPKRMWKTLVFLSHRSDLKQRLAE